MDNLVLPRKMKLCIGTLSFSFRIEKLEIFRLTELLIYLFKFSKILKISARRSVSWSGVRGSKTVTVYSSPQRDAVLRLCGWKGEAVISPHAPSDHLAATARRAAVAIFQVKLFISRLSLENN